MAAEVRVHKVSQQDELVVPGCVSEIHESEMQMVEDVAERSIDVGGLVADADPPIHARAPQIRNDLNLSTFGGRLRRSGLTEHFRDECQETNYDHKDKMKPSHDVTPVLK